MEVWNEPDSMGYMAAAKFGLDSLTVILDYNDVQLDGFVHDVMPLEPLAEGGPARLAYSPGTKRT